MRPNPRLKAVHGVALALLLAGCARFAPPSRTVAPIVLPASGADPAPYEEALTQRLAGLASFRATGILQFERTGDPVRQIDFLLLSSGRSNIRLRGMRAIGPTLFELIADDQRYAFSIPTRRQWYAGVRGGEEDASKLLVPSSVIDPLRVGLRPGSIRYVEHLSGETHLVELVRVVEGGPWRAVQRIEFGQETGRLRRVLAFNADGGVAQITSFGDYRELPGFGPADAFPFRLQVERPGAGMIVTFIFRRVSPNVDAPPEAFDVTPPPGFAVLPAAEFDPERVADAAEGASAD